MSRGKRKTEEKRGAPMNKGTLVRIAGLATSNHDNSMFLKTVVPS